MPRPPRSTGRRDRAARAALALGAAGVQAGTAFLCCPEARTSAVHRAALVGGLPDVEGDTAVTAALRDYVEGAA